MAGRGEVDVGDEGCDEAPDGFVTLEQAPEVPAAGGTGPDESPPPVQTWAISAAGPTSPGAWHAELRAVWHLAWPLALVQLNHNLTGAVDAALAGRVSAVALGGTGLGAVVFAVYSVLAYGAGLGVEPLMAQAVGAQKFGRARALFRQGLQVALVSALPITFLGVLTALSFERLGVAADVAAAGRAYLWGRLPSIPVYCVVMVLRSFLQAHRTTKPILWSAVLMNSFNLVADYVLLFGDAGLVRLGLPAMGIPALGVLGIGIASAAATLVQISIMGHYARRIMRRPLAVPEPTWDAVTARAVRGRIARLGTPACAQLCAEVALFSLVGIAVGGMGAVVAAAHQTALMLANLSFAIAVGVGAATGVHVAHAIGSGNSVATRRAGFAGGVLGVGFMTLSASVMWLFPEPLIALMTSDPEVVAAAAPLLRIAGVFQIFDGAQAVASGALRGAGSTRWAFVANMVAYWVVAFPVAAIGAYVLHGGPEGLWWGLTAGLCTAAVALCGRFYRLSARPIAALQV